MCIHNANTPLGNNTASSNVSNIYAKPGGIDTYVFATTKNTSEHHNVNSDGHRLCGSMLCYSVGCIVGVGVHTNNYNTAMDITTCVDFKF